MSIDRLIAVGLVNADYINNSVGHDGGTSTDSIANKEQQHEYLSHRLQDN
jgi:hypothetical protein